MGCCDSSPKDGREWKPYDQQPEDAPEPYRKPEVKNKKAEDEEGKQFVAGPEEYWP